jgi:hypothetical protein
MVGICNGERISKTVERSVVESVFLKLIVRNYFRKAVYAKRLLFPVMMRSHKPTPWLMPS